MLDKSYIRDSDDKFLWDLRHDPTGEIATLTARLEAAEETIKTMARHISKRTGQVTQARMERDEAVEICQKAHVLLYNNHQAATVYNMLQTFLKAQQRPVKTNEEGEGG